MHAIICETIITPVLNFLENLDESLSGNNFRYFKVLDSLNVEFYKPCFFHSVGKCLEQLLRAINCASPANTCFFMYNLVMYTPFQKSEETLLFNFFSIYVFNNYNLLTDSDFLSLVFSG